MDSRSVFEKNLAAIRRRSEQLARALEAASSEGVEEVVGPRGAVTLRQDGVLLGSTYDPIREGVQLAEKMAEAPADIMIAVGFGLGRQFEPYLERNPGTLIVYEPSLPRLRAALERISIANLYARNRDLYIATDPNQLSNQLAARYVPGLRIRVFPHPALLRLDREAVAAIVERVRRVKDASDTRSVTSIEQLAPWAWITAGNGRRIAERVAFGRLENLFRGKPAVVVAAGPSLDKQLPILRAHRDQLVVIAIGQTLKALRAAGIEPDLVHILESRDVSHQLTDAGDTSGLCVALSSDCHPAILDVPARASFVVTAGASPLGIWIAKAVGEGGFTMGGGTVAQGAVGLALALGANPILLIGQDLAFTDGRAYARGSAYDFVEVDLDEAGQCTFKNMKRKVGLLGDRDLDTIEDEARKGQVIWVDGWREGEKVPTWRAYAAFIEQYREIGILLDRVGVQLVNCTEGGARIPGLQHRPFAEVLAELDTTPFASREAILAVHDAAPRYALADFEPAIARARKAIAGVEKGGAPRDPGGPAERHASAHGAQRPATRRGTPWPRPPREAREARARAHPLARRTRPAGDLQRDRRGASDGTHRRLLEELAEESGYLFEAARRGIERARDWFEAFEASFDEAADTVASEAPAAQPGGPRSAAGQPSLRTSSPSVRPMPAAASDR
ncbi:MAG: 6-hydroxymethylpterin diphosphokinase MptE-like protein [Myxococcota bacterium]